MNHQRQLFSIPLRPAIGDRFQPTGFPNLGAAEFYRPVADDAWERCLLVESEQSMANRLEATLWDHAAQKPVELVAALPDVRIIGPHGDFLTSSRLEAHRIASAYVREGVVDGEDAIDVVNRRLGLDSDRQRAPYEIAEGLFKLDPMVLIHGVFMSDKKFPGQPKVARAITSFVEAHDVREAYGGGVKKDSVFTSQQDGRGSSEGYGMVPFDRVEWTARQIVMNVDLDLQQIHGYGLSEAATELLANLARLELRYLLDGGLRFRTACDLVVDGDVVDHTGTALPPATSLEAAIRDGINAVSDLIGEPLTVVWDK